MTENALAEDTASRNLQDLHDLHELGVRLAIDDFGTGWSSMERLAAFPWDLLKIDKSFVQALAEPNHFAEYVVSSTIALAHALGIPTTAEGVETPEQLDRLAQLGCDIAQGHLFARPLQLATRSPTSPRTLGGPAQGSPPHTTRRPRPAARPTSHSLSAGTASTEPQSRRRRLLSHCVDGLAPGAVAV